MAVLAYNTLTALKGRPLPFRRDWPTLTFFHFAAFELTDHADQIRRILAVSGRRFARRRVAIFCRPEIDALLAVTDQRGWSGPRDHALMPVAVQTGLWQSDITALRRGDLLLGAGAHVRVLGKGWKVRCMPFGKQTDGVMKESPPTSLDPVRSSRFLTQRMAA